jgi:hypothetical protein
MRVDLSGLLAGKPETKSKYIGIHPESAMASNGQKRQVGVISVVARPSPRGFGQA